MFNLVNLRRRRFALCLVCVALTASAGPSESEARADELPLVTVDRQPLTAAVRRVIQAMEFAGSPLPPEVIQAVDAAAAETDDPQAVRMLQQTLDPHCLVDIHINAESRVKVQAGPAGAELMQQGWTAFLVKVRNEAGINPELRVSSPNAAPMYQQGRGAREQPRIDERLVDLSEVADRWLDVSLVSREPLSRRLSGLAVEYRILLLFSRDKGPREATLSFDVGQGTQDLGFRNSVPILFQCRPACEVTLNVTDTDGSPTTAAFLIRDEQNRVYPNPARRLAPDFFFHHQIYRHSGESVRLPPGNYTITVTRGPEYLPERKQVAIPEEPSAELQFSLQRWVHAAQKNWFSGDHHVHAAGCAHYDSPTEGVTPDDMMRHLLGEDVNVGCVLSWGPCWYTQKQYFEGAVSELSGEQNLMRYDVEVSGFPSSHAGHLCLLNLNEDDYPGTERLEDWPSWTLPVLQWGQDQGGIVGYSHSGWGLALPDVMPDGSRRFPGRPWGGAANGWQGKAASELPDYAMPPFDGIGANEYVVSTALGACDFISTVDTPAIWELNIWYHTLNCGMTSVISGETDFPCIYGERVGLGRIYVKMPEEEPLTYARWVEGLRDGRSYCGDGLSHIFDFQVDDVAVGSRNESDEVSTLHLDGPSTVEVTFDATALLEPEPTDATESIRRRRLDEKPYWHIERCRIDDSRDVNVEIIVNGEVAAVERMTADGSLSDFRIPVEISDSSWIAVRILPSVHTNPVFVKVNDQPIRCNPRSAEWCRKAVGVCWESKRGGIRAGETAAAERAYRLAESIYASVQQEAEARKATK